MPTTPLFSAILLVACLIACSSSDKKNPLLLEAANFHQQATDIQANVEPQIDQIDSLKTVLMATKMPAVAARIATLDSLKTAFKDWEENLVEVPGMLHNHTHRIGGQDQGKHDHKHADPTLKDLPADQMRDLQRETLNSIKQIQSRLETVTKPN